VAVLCRLEARSLPLKRSLELCARHQVNICVHRGRGKASVSGPRIRRSSIASTRPAAPAVRSIDQEPDPDDGGSSMIHETSLIGL
jgi:hypothetical protein